jgi:outer membrane protein assembly factor BamB
MSKRILWKFRAEERMTRAAVTHGIVSFSTDKHVYGVDIVTGEERWRQKGSGSQICAWKSLFVLSAKNGLRAIDSKSGRDLWEFPAEDRPTRLEAAGELIYSLEKSHETVALNLDRRTLSWRTVGLSLGHAGATSFVAARHADFPGLLRAVSSSGEEKWRALFPHPLASRPTLADAVLVVATSAELRGLEFKTGRTLWTMPLSGAKSDVVSDDKAAYLMADKELVAVRSGKVLFRRKHELGTLLFHEGKLYFVGKKNFCELERKTGRVVWSEPAAGAAVIANQVAYVAGAGTLRAIQLVT